MSFGFGVGDFLAVLELANKIRKQFADAPSELQAITAECQNLSTVLLEADVLLSSPDVPADARKLADDVVKNCRGVLQELEKFIQKHSALQSNSKEDIKVRHRVNRLWQKGKWNPEDVRDFRSRLTSNISTLNTLAHARLQRTTDYLVLHMNRLVMHGNDQQRSEMVNWISSSDYGNAAKQSDLLSQRVDGTRSPLLDSSALKKWRETKGSIILCTGIPGSGKTMTTAMVVEDLQSRVTDDRATVVYVYCSYQQHENQSSTDLFTTILRCLLQQTPTIPETTRRLLEDSMRTGRRLLKDQILLCITALISDSDNMHILMDVLDELAEDSRRELLRELLNLHQASDFHLYLTSRQSTAQEINRCFSGCGIVEEEIRASVEDVRIYLEGNITKLPQFVLDSRKIQAKIIKDISMVVDGMFLLAELHLDSFKTKISKYDLAKALKKLPCGSDAYDEAYARAWERIESQHQDWRDLARKALIVLICVHRPLTKEELCDALSIDLEDLENSENAEILKDLEDFEELGGDDQGIPDTKDRFEGNVPMIELVLTTCAGLVTVDEESNVVRFVHKSTLDYFQRRRVDLFPDADATMTAICVVYKDVKDSFRIVDQGVTQFIEFPSTKWPKNQKTKHQRSTNHDQKRPFYDYAAKNYLRHWRAATDQDEPGPVAGMMPMDHGSGSIWNLASQLGVKQFAKDMRSLDFVIIEACRKGMLGLLEGLLDTSQYDLTHGQDRKPSYHREVVKPEKDDVLITIATRRGYINIVDMLLTRGASPNSVSYDGYTPLYLAARHGYDRIVCLLISHHETDIYQAGHYLD